MKTNSEETGYGKRLLTKVISRFILALIFVGFLLFISAGTFKFINAWIFIVGLFIPMIFTLIFLYKKDPELLEKRLNMQEKENEQKKYIKLSMFFYIIAYIVPGLDFRFHWSEVPVWLAIAALILMILGYVMFVMVMIQNRYASRIIEIQHEQRLIDTGLYSIVRHPMYTAAIILFLSSSLVLGSYYALIPMLFLPILLAFRIINEEKVLLSGLPGYDAYIKKVRFRLIPYLW